MHSPPDAHDAFRIWRSEPANWQSVVGEILKRHGVKADAFTRFSTGTNLVIALNGELILKVFPAIYRAQFLSERSALRQLAGRIEVAIPEILFEGDMGDFCYLIMTRLDGVLGSVCWEGLPEDQKEIVLEQIGETIAQVQKAPLGSLAAIEPGWKDFMSRQIAGCHARHAGLGLPPRLLHELDRLLQDASDIIPMDAPPVILTGEYIPENFLLSETARGWRLASLIDFGDVFTGWGEYDLLGPSAFMAAGRPGRVASLLRGFGYAPAEIDPKLTRRLLTLMFLHRASDPLRHICVPGWERTISSLAELERLVWPLGDGIMPIQL
jgi:hygromycin-B 7''-O-kinase